MTMQARRPTVTAVTLAAVLLYQCWEANMLERRKWIRFPMELAARLKHGRTASEGVTVNVSSGGALIKSATELSPGTHVEAHFQWPVSLEECKLKLVMTGSVVWTQGLLTAISARRYEFRTVGKRN